MKIALIHHRDCEKHEAGLAHVEQSARVNVIQAALERYPFREEVSIVEAPLASREQLISVHDAAYVDWLFSMAPEKGYLELDPDTYMNPHTLKAALHAAGSVPFAVDLVMENKAQVAFCNVRPPGHHAERARAMGFCFFNNVAIGAMHALSKYQLKRIAIIDFDAHHGNGTQDMFQNDGRVMYCSSFQNPLFPGYNPEMDNDHILSVPLEPGTKGELFRDKVRAAWFAKLEAFQPEFIFFSAGFDGHADEPLADLNLTKTDYIWLTTQIATLAKQFCNGRMVSVLEGGYNLNVLASCVPAHVNAMAI